MSRDTQSPGVPVITTQTQQLDPPQMARMLRDQYKGTFMVMWSEWSQLFIAWATWIGGGGVMIQERDPQQLARLMNGQLQHYGIRVP